MQLTFKIFSKYLFPLTLNIVFLSTQMTTEIFPNGHFCCTEFLFVKSEVMTDSICILIYSLNKNDHTAAQREICKNQQP